MWHYIISYGTNERCCRNKTDVAGPKPVPCCVGAQGQDGGQTERSTAQ